MNIRNLISYGLLILILGLVQILFLRNLAVFGHAFGFLYLLGLLILPSTIRTIPLMLIAFCLGFILDVFFETIGMHTAAATLFAFLKPIWLKAASPTGGFDEAGSPALGRSGLDATSAMPFHSYLCMHSPFLLQTNGVLADFLGS